MPEQTTANSTTEITPDQPWNRTSVITLLAVVVLWYIGTIAVVLTQVQ